MNYKPNYLVWCITFVIIAIASLFFNQRLLFDYTEYGDAILETFNYTKLIIFVLIAVSVSYIISILVSNIFKMNVNN